MPLLVLILVALTLGLAACGGDDGEDSSSATNSGSSPVPTESTPEPADSDCTETQTEPVEPPEDYKGFVTLCRSVLNTSLLVQNISNVVIVVNQDRKQPRLRVWKPADDSLTTAVIREIPMSSCGDTWCRILPGGHLVASGTPPVRVFLDTNPYYTTSVAMASSIASIAASRLKSAPQRALNLAGSCVEKSGDALQGQHWQEAFRDGIVGYESCKSLVKMLYPEAVAPEERFIPRMISKAKSLSNGLWIDGLLMASRAVK